MPARLIACLLLILFGAARSASADVSVTDQQNYTGGQRGMSTARTSAPLAGGQIPRLIDATGFEWFINDEVVYATESSAVGAASDASFIAPVEATTANGGSELSILYDAFDGYNALRVSVDGGAPVFYNQVGSATSDCGGRQIVMPVRDISGLQVSRKVYVPTDDGFARWLNIVSNPGGAPRTVTLEMVSDLGSDANTRIGATSSGDAVADLSDGWITSYEEFEHTSSRTPRLAHVLQSPGSAVGLSSVSFTNGNDQTAWGYSFTVPAGGTIVVMNFAAGLTSLSDASLKAAQLATLPPTTRACLSSVEQASLVNMVPADVPSGPEPTGPAGLAITSPTTESTFTANSNFVALGGEAGATQLTGLTWTSDRGFEGAALGATQWTVPNVPLLPGANVITVNAHYADGQPPLTDTITVNLGATSYLLPEGSTGVFFSTDLLIANPNDGAVEADIRFLRPDGTAVALPLQELLPRSRTTIAVDSVAGLTDGVPVSSLVTSTSGAPLVVERTMFWDDTSYGSHGVAAIEGPRTRWLFGEGAQGFFNTYLLLANANVASAQVNLLFLTRAHGTVTRSYTMAPNSRTTVDIASIPELVDQEFAIDVTSDLPIVTERSMYFGSPLFNGGHASSGVSLPSTQWLFAEGASGSFFDTFFLIGNPGSRTADVTMTYQLTTGGAVTINRQVAPYSRATINAAAEHDLLQATAFSLRITSDEPITAERSMYWGRVATGEWYEAHNSFGVNEAGMKWGLAEGRVGSDRNFHTYILIGNASDDASMVRVTFLRVGGGTVVKDYAVAANTRFSLDVNTMVPELVNEEFGATVEVLDGSPVTVERALYSDANGVIFAAGTATQAVRLP